MMVNEWDAVISGGKGESGQQTAVNVSRPDDAGFKPVTYNKQKPKNSTIMTRPPLKLIGKRATKTM